MISNPTAPNPSKLMAQLRMMPDQQLVQYAQMHKNDPYIFPMAFQESNTRKQMRAAQNTQAPPAPKVVDQNLQEMAQPMPEDQGIATLPAPNMQNMAGGGIVAFDDGGEVPGYAEGVFTGVKKKYKQLKGYQFEGGPELFEKALDAEGIKDPAQRAFLKSVHAQESDQALNAPTRDKSGAMGPMQVTKGAWTDVSSKGAELKDRADPFENMRAGIRYASTGWQKSGGDPVLAGAYYYGGPGGLAKAQKGEAVASAEDKGQTTFQYGKQVAARMPSMIPFVGTATAAATNPAINQIPGQSVKAPPAKAAGITALTGDDNFTDPMTGFSPTQAPVGEKPRVLSKEGARQAMLGVGDLPYAFAGATSDIGNAVLRGLTLGRYNETEPTLGSAHLKRLATEYLGREAESADPAMRNMRTAGEIAGTFINPVAATRTAATQTEAGLNALLGAQKVKEAAAVSTPAKMPLRLTAEQPAIPVTSAGEAAASVVGSGGRSVQETQKVLEAERLANQARDQLAANQLAKQAARYAEPNPLLAETAKVASPGEKAARAIQIAGETATVAPQGLATITPTETQPEAPRGGMPDLNSAFRQFEIDQQNKTEGVQVAKPEAEGLSVKDLPKDPITGGMDMNRLMMQMGLHLMAGKSPNLLTNVGEAGLGTLAMQQAEEKAKSEREAKMSEAEYRKAMGKYYGAYGEAIERGAKDKNNVALAEKAAQDAVDTWAKNNKMALLQSPDLYEQMRKKYRMEAYQSFGITPTMTAGAPTGGAKFLGFENPA